MCGMLNCWEFMKCGKDITKDCVAVEKNTGDLCWLVTGTMCGDKPQGTLAQKIGDCKKCGYFQYRKDIMSGTAMA
jgi:methyl-accepting chemotaxis protein